MCSNVWGCMWKYCSHLETAGGHAWIFVYGLHFGWVSSKNIPLSSAVQKDAAQVGWRLADASLRIVIRRRCLLASPAKHAGIHIDDLEYQEGTEKKKKRCFFRSHRAQLEREARWTAWTEAFTGSIVLARCKPRPRAHIYRPKLSFVYLWKMNLRKNKPPAVPSANLSSTQTPHLLWASLRLPNIFKNGSKTTSKRWRLVSAEK